MQAGNEVGFPGACALILALLLAGCLPAPARDAAQPARRPAPSPAQWRTAVHAIGDGPATYAGPVVPAAPAPGDAGRVLCTGVVIRLPGTIVFQGSHGPVLAAVTTNLSAGQYTMRHDAASGVARIAPWPPGATLDVELAGLPQDVILFQAYLASMAAPIPLRVVPAGGNGSGPGGACAACTRVDSLGADEATDFIAALGRGLPPGERARWLAWATRFAAQTARRQPGTSLVDEVRALLAVSGPGMGTSARTTAAVLGDPARRQSWNDLRAWEQMLWRSYVQRYGETADVTDPARRDLQITEAVRLSMALRMSPQYMQPGAREAATLLFNDPMFLGATVGGISAYFLLIVAPEPFLTKATAVLTTVALVSLAGFAASELVSLAHAWMRLREESARAFMLSELEQAAANFGHAIGGSGVRILAVLATVLVGQVLPGGPAAGAAPAAALAPARVAGVGGGGAVMTVAAAEVGWAVRVLADGAVVIMAMSAAGDGAGGGPRGGGGAAGDGKSAASEGERTPRGSKPGGQGKPSSMRVETGPEFAPHPAIEGVREPGPIRSFTSHSSFTSYMGKAGPGKEWHHIVEQTPGNVARFGSRILHNTANVIKIDEQIHRQISAYYSRINEITGGQTFRRWLSSRPFEAQREAGIDVLRQFGVIP